MSDVFISYSRKNKSFAQQLFDRLESSGRDSWVDWEGIPFSANWRRQIRRGIESANTVVFIMSPASLASPVCQLEIAHAISCGSHANLYVLD